ncbi:MAG: M48 family metalloprotease [Acidobacteria bacterium]|nr:M48 family metalloprotease [Acidobacteriota bacterium]MBV9475034.1 M48 family metalloprotease [Acidobacteriota bacterium]
MNRAGHALARPLLALMFVATLATDAAYAQTKVNPGFNLFSAQQDVEIGSQSAAQAEQQLPILRDSAVDNYVNRIGQRLAANAGGPQFQYRFRVVNASDINAFALPGGYVYVNRGILENAKNEGEVAGVIAHEIAHVSLRHGTHQASKAYAAQAGLQILGGILGGRVGGGTAQILNAVGGLGLNALFLKFSRDLESQADVRGAQILAASGYSPIDMVNFFHTLESVDQSHKTNWLSDHPAPPDRIARIQKESQMLRVASAPTTNPQQLASIKTSLRRYGNAPTSAQIAQGVARTNPPMTSSTGTSSGAAIGNVAAPSRQWRTYTNKTASYQVAYPSNWQVYPSNGFGVTIAPQGGVGNANGRAEIVYGLVINHYDPFGNNPRAYLNNGGGTGGQITLQEATQDLLQQIQSNSPHLRLLSNQGQRVNIDGRTGMAVALGGRNPNTGVDERVTVVTRGLPDGHVIYMLFVTPEQQASAYNGVLNQMLSSLQVDDTHGH